MPILIIDTLIYLGAAVFAALALTRGVRGSTWWFAVGAVNFAILSALEWGLGGPGSLVRLSVAGLPVVQILKQCGTGFFFLMGLRAALGEQRTRTAT